LVVNNILEDEVKPLEENVENHVIRSVINDDLASQVFFIISVKGIKLDHTVCTENINYEEEVGTIEAQRLSST